MVNQSFQAPTEAEPRAEDIRAARIATGLTVEAAAGTDMHRQMHPTMGELFRIKVAKNR